jgi:hypothetical protein
VDIMRILALCGILLLSGCSYFWPPEQGYQRAGTSADVENSDLASCQQQARAMIARDRQIDSDITSQGVTAGYLRSDETLESNLSQFRETNRYDEIVLDCMAARGYGAPDP